MEASSLESLNRPRRCFLGILCRDYSVRVYCKTNIVQFLLAENKFGEIVDDPMAISVGQKFTGVHKISAYAAIP